MDEETKVKKERDYKQNLGACVEGFELVLSSPERRNPGHTSTPRGKKLTYRKSFIDPFL